MGESCGMEIIDFFPGASPEGNHAAVASRGGSFIEWFSDPEPEFARAIILIGSPARRNTIPFRVACDAALHAQRRKSCVVESSSPQKVIGTEVDVGEHWAFLAAA